MHDKIKISRNKITNEIIESLFKNLDFIDFNFYYCDINKDYIYELQPIDERGINNKSILISFFKRNIEKIIYTKDKKGISFYFTGMLITIINGLEIKKISINPL